MYVELYKDSKASILLSNSFIYSVGIVSLLSIFSFNAKAFCFINLTSILPSLLYLNPSINEVKFFILKSLLHNNEIVSKISGILDVLISSIIILLIFAPYANYLLNIHYIR